MAQIALTYYIGNWNTVALPILFSFSCSVSRLSYNVMNLVADTARLEMQWLYLSVVHLGMPCPWPI